MAKIRNICLKQNLGSKNVFDSVDSITSPCIWEANLLPKHSFPEMFFFSSAGPLDFKESNPKTSRKVYDL